MDTSQCATRAHIDTGSSFEGPPERASATLFNTLRAEWFYLALWILVVVVAFILFGMTGLAVASGIFVLMVLIFLGVRVSKGHTLKCAALGALATTLRVTEGF